MKLKNKKTGEMGNAIIDKDLFVVRTDKKWSHYDSLAELNEEWEDAPEGPKKYWWISDYLTIYEGEARNDTIWHRDKCKQIGNYFETKEEAEKAVERLRAWKRLRDKGFKFGDYINMENIKAEEWFDYRHDKLKSDLDICFGGGE